MNKKRLRKRKEQSKKDNTIITINFIIAIINLITALINFFK
ncbi:MULTISPECIES: hypothetical protein [unclassified Gemella]|nr:MULTISPECIES: hypothetical protein [unclassified Gemella]